MRGWFCHNEVLTKRLQQVAVECEATVETEAPVRVGEHICYGDLLVRKYGRSTLCELETSSQGVDKDLRKASALGAEVLLIATPDAPTAHACQRRLQRCRELAPTLKVMICPLGAALGILRAILTRTPESVTEKGKKN